MRKNIVILIAGPSGSGKTTFSKILAETINGIPLHLDDLFLGHNYVNYDNPLMIAKAAGIICRKVANFENKPVIADFLFYKRNLREAFKFDFAVLMNTGKDMVSFEQDGFNHIIDVKDAVNQAAALKTVLEKKFE